MADTCESWASSRLKRIGTWRTFTPHRMAGRSASRTEIHCTRCQSTGPERDEMQSQYNMHPRSPRRHSKGRAWAVTLLGMPVFLVVAAGILLGLDWRQARLNADLIAAIERPDSASARLLLKQGANPNAAKPA